MDALAIVREHLKGKLKLAMSAMSFHWPRVGLLQPRGKRGSKIVTSALGPAAPPNMGKSCLIWVARSGHVASGLPAGCHGHRALRGWAAALRAGCGVREGLNSRSHHGWMVCHYHSRQHTHWKCETCW